MDGGQNEIVIIEQRHAGLIAGGIGGIERQLGQESLARRITGGDGFQLDQIGAARRRILMDAIEMRLVPAARQFEFGGPAGAAGFDLADHVDEAAPVMRRTWRRWRQRKGHDRIGRRDDVIQRLLRRGRPDAGQQLHQPEAGDAITRIFDEAQQRQHVLDMGGVEKFEAAEFDERDIPARQFDLERAAMRRGAEQHGLFL